MRARAAVLALCLLLAGCFSLRREAARPGSTHLGSAPVALPAVAAGNMMVVEAKWDRYGPYHFLIDTGSSVTLVTPELARRYPAGNAAAPALPEVRVRSAEGGTTVLPAAMLDRIELGAARFSTVPAAVYDCSSLSDQLGIKIDGVLGFPLFRETLLTLDYRHGKVILRPAAPGPFPAILPGSTLSFTDTDKIPIVSVRIGDRAVSAFIDSGSADVMSLNLEGLGAHFAFGPTTGLTTGTLTGDQTEQVGRLAETLRVGDYAIAQPVVVATNGLSVLGGGLLRHFTVTFDQEHDRVTFYREGAGAIAIPGVRSTGLSVRREPAYWRVVGVVPGSPADRAEVETGDLITRINGEPVGRWGAMRYGQALAGADSLDVTFLEGVRETTKKLGVTDLVP